MRETSLLMLELAQNSLDAGATTVNMTVTQDGEAQRVVIEDDGAGMDELTLRQALEGELQSASKGRGLKQVSDEVKACGGTLDIRSQRGKGTRAELYFERGARLGDIGATVVPLLTGSADIVLTIKRGEQIYVFDTRKLKEQGVDVSSPHMLVKIRQQINLNNQ